MTKQTKLNFIELIKKEKDNGEFETVVYYTPKFIPFSKLIQLTKTLEAMEEKTEMEAMDEMFKVVCDLYNNQFTVEELQGGLHAPEAVETLQEQIEFISSGKVSEENDKRLKELLK